MSKYILRLDDACPKMEHGKWLRVEKMLDKYGVKPIVGVIPDCKDPDFKDFSFDNSFWSITIKRWEKKDWTIALHGFNHVFNTKEGGINPVNRKSEFAGLPYEEQLTMILEGVKIFRQNGVEPKVFFAPAHTFDTNTLKALEKGSEIRIISDTPAWNIYSNNGFTFVPQQCGTVRKLPFSVITFCYHPNSMSESDFEKLEEFINKNNKRFIPFPTYETRRKRSILDKLLNKLYFYRKRK